MLIRPFEVRLETTLASALRPLDAVHAAKWKWANYCECAMIGTKMSCQWRDRHLIREYCHFQNECEHKTEACYLLYNSCFRNALVTL